MFYLFIFSLVGLAGMLWLNHSGKLGRFLSADGVVGSASRGMVGVFSFFVVAIALISTIGILLVIGIIAIVATAVGWKLRKGNFYWNFKGKPSSDQTDEPRDPHQGQQEIKTITLNPDDWRDVTATEEKEKRWSGWGWGGRKSPPPPTGKN